MPIVFGILSLYKWQKIVSLRKSQNTKRNHLHRRTTRFVNFMGSFYSFIVEAFGSATSKQA